MAFFIEYEKLNELPKLNENMLNFGRDIFIENDKTLIKVISDDIQNMITYLSILPEHEHVIKPLEVGEIVYPEKISSNTPIYKSSYRMHYLQNAKTLLTMYKENISYEQKMTYAKQLFSALQFLHQYIVVGDIHSQNILISDENAYIIDLDNSKKLNSYNQVYCFYYINILRSFGNNKYTDIIKMYLECLAFILEIDFPRFICKKGYAEFYKIITSHSLPPEVLSFFKISSSNKFKKLGEEAYDFEKFMTPEVLVR